MLQKELNVNIDYLIDNGLVNYSDGDMVMLDSSKQPHIDITVKLEMISIIYVESGWVQVDLNGTTIKASVGDLIVSPPNSFVNNANSSEEYSAKVIGLSYKAMQRSLLMSKDIWGILAYVWRNPVIHLSSQSSDLIRKYHALIKYKIENPHGYYHKEIMQSLFHCIFYEISAVIAPQLGNLRHDGQFSQGELLFKRFVELLASYDGSDRSVKSYAGQLCVTPKYLSTVCKSVSGKTALEWIHDYLANSITHKLKYTEGSIKEIADDLGFPNISFFGKFVKSRFGMSPKEYRQHLQQTVAE
mgnify:CR=1 FL=1